MALTIGSVLLGTITGVNLASSLTHNIITSTINGTYSISKQLLTYHNSEIKTILEEYDLIATIEIIESVIDSNINNIEKNFVKKSIELLHTVLSNIHTILNDINLIIIDHKNKWFSNWRSLNYDHKILELKHNIKILKKRYKLFIDIINL